MKHYIRFLALFVLVQLGVLAGLMVMAQPPDNYRAAVLDKERLLRETPSPRVVLVGGSSLAFGVDSPTVEAGIGSGYRVVNMGLHAGLGLDFMLNEALDGVRAGDIVVLSPEYDVLWNDAIQPVDMVETLRFAPGALRYTASRDRLGLLRAMVLEQPPVMLHDIAVTALRSRVARLRSPGAYYRASFNANGDNVAARSLDRTYERDLGQLRARVDERAYRRNLTTVKGFAEKARRRGALVFFACPPVDDASYRMNRELVDRTIADVERSAKVTILGPPATEAFPEDSFYDTGNHLRGEAVFSRSRRLGAALLASMQNPEP